MRVKHFIPVFAAVSGLILPLATCFTRGGEEALRNRLMTGYNQEVRPDQVTIIFMLFHVTSISVVDIRNEIFSVSGWWSMRWSDDRLTWADYPQIPVVQFRESRIWTPTIVVSNSIDNLAAIREDSIPVRVDRNGTVSWTPPGLMQVSCGMDITYFPFDKQTCSIEVTSFGYTIREINVKTDGDGLSFRYYSSSGEWSMDGTYTRRTEYTEGGHKFARVEYYFDISRMPLYYGLNMLLPVIVCSALTLFVFLLPSESGEKIGYCLTVLLAYMVILTLVAQDLPTTASSTSILEVYIAMVMILGTVSVVLSIMILHLFFLPDEKPVGPCMQRLTRFFISLCCLGDSRCCKGERFEEPGPVARPERGPDYRYYTGRLQHQPSFGPDSIYSQPHEARDQRKGTDDVKMTWQLVSRTLDTVLYRLYLLCILTSTVVFVVLLAGG